MIKDLLQLNKALDSLDVHRKHVVAVMVVDKEKGKILLGKRRKDGIWTGPAGHLQGEESARQCIIREAFEEANLKLKTPELKDLPSVPLEKGRVCHVYLAYVDSETLNLHPKNDPDEEVSRWEWFDINGKMPSPIDEPRIISINNARMKAMGLKKSILENPDAGIDLNTAEQSLDEMAARDNEWVDRIKEAMRFAQLGDGPKELHLPGHLLLSLVKVDDGLYTGILKKFDPISGDYGEVQTQLMKMTAEAMVQALKAKGYLSSDHQVKKPKDYSQLYEALKTFEGDMKIELTIQKSLNDELLKELI